jgi:hypothetical protein
MDVNTIMRPLISPNRRGITKTRVLDFFVTSVHFVVQLLFFGILRSPAKNKSPKKQGTTPMGHTLAFCGSVVTKK